MEKHHSYFRGTERWRCVSNISHQRTCNDRYVLNIKYVFPLSVTNIMQSNLVINLRITLPHKCNSIRLLQVLKIYTELNKNSYS